MWKMTLDKLLLRTIKCQKENLEKNKQNCMELAQKDTRISATELRAQKCTFDSMVYLVYAKGGEDV